jgi:cytochrome c-type biogenesis protein CcmH/NrfG
MMMNRNGPSIWVRIVAILLAAGFLIGTILIGFSASGASYNLLDIIGGGQQSQSQQQSQDLGPQIQEAEQNLEQNPKDPDAITDLATLYISDGQTSKGVSVLEDGMEKAPDNADIPLLLGNARIQQAQAQPEGERQEAFRQGGDAFAAATESEPENADAFISAGSAYDQAGDTGEAIQYYNGYLDLEPDSEEASQVEDRISTLLNEGGSGGEGSGGTSSTTSEP